MNIKLLNTYEKKLKNAIDNDELIDVPNQKAENERYQNIATSYLAKNRRITIRINDQDLQEIRRKANEGGIAYQTLITTILHQVVHNKIAIKI